MVPADAPGVVVHDDWDALGMRASGSNSISLERVALPQSGVRGGFRAGDPLPYMERNLVAGLFHAAASLGIAESADAIARRGIAGRSNGDARPRMQVADNAVDLAAARGVLSRAAALIDEHHTATRRPTAAPSSSARSSPRLRPPRRSSTRRPRASWTARSHSRAAPATSTAARSRAPTATSRPAPSCTRSAPTAPTTTSLTSLSAKTRSSTEMALAAPAPAPAAAAPDARSFRDALGRFATGVAFVTAAPDGEPAGLIVNSLTSVSLEPPLVSFCPSRSSLTWSRMRRARRFGVNVLGRQHERFATRATPAGTDRFAGLDWELARGVPLLTDALASLVCEIVAEHPTGDHWIVVGRIDNLRISPIKDPLIFFAGAFGALQQRT
jgi:3-hydroxy-9,10-secoandrosta-1,3,5(10)-triene-9,17-dione monooxygenase reductase component